MIVHDRLPASEDAMRKALYRGELYLLEGTPVTRQLVRELTAELERELGDPREAQFRFGDEEYFQHIGRLRKMFYTGEPYHQAVRTVIRDAGVDPAAVWFDPIRLRVITHRGDENPRAAPIYHAHRDTWYANPQCQVTWWIPLHDVSEQETFVFFPDYFAHAVANDSETFDHDDWVAIDQRRKIGWQDRDTGLTASYPSLQQEAGGERWTFSCPAGHLLIFAGQHLHRTTPNRTGRTRFSVDFRTADLSDLAAGRGAPNVDNRSRGSAVRL